MYRESERLRSPNLHKERERQIAGARGRGRGRMDDRGKEARSTVRAREPISKIPSLLRDSKRLFVR